MTSIQLEIDQALEDDLKNILRFNLFARRSDPGGSLDFESDKARELAVILGIETAARLARSITGNAASCKDIIEDFLGYDPFFNDEGEYEEPEELARKLGLSIRRIPKRRTKPYARGGAVPPKNTAEAFSNVDRR